MKDGIIIQARTGSTRLHNKILLPFYGEQRIIDILIANIKQACPDKCIVLATTNRPQDDVLAETARQAGILSFRGDEDNVLDRFIRAAEVFGINRFIRVCSDNPFLRPETFNTFFAELDKGTQDKVLYVLMLLRTQDRLPTKFIKAIRDGLFEVRIEYNSNIYRIFFVFDGNKIVVLFNGFQKKTQKTPTNEIKKALKLKEEYYASKRD